MLLQAAQAATLMDSKSLLPFIKNYGIELLAYLCAPATIYAFRYRLLKIWLFIYYKIPFMQDIVALRSQNARVLNLLANMDENQINILKELKPNGGTSMRDAIDRTGDNVARVVTKMKLHEDTFDFGTFQTTSDGLFTSMNEPLLEMCGRDRDEIVDNGWINFVHYDDRDFVSRHYNEAIDDKTDMDLQFRMLHKNNTCFKVRLMAKRSVNNGRIVGYIGTMKKL
jgi:PAS domain S-box-containing protein